MKIMNGFHIVKLSKCINVDWKVPINSMKYVYLAKVISKRSNHKLGYQIKEKKILRNFLYFGISKNIFF